MLLLIIDVVKPGVCFFHFLFYSVWLEWTEFHQTRLCMQLTLTGQGDTLDISSGILGLTFNRILQMHNASLHWIEVAGTKAVWFAMACQKSPEAAHISIWDSKAGMSWQGQSHLQLVECPSVQQVNKRYWQTVPREERNQFTDPLERSTAALGHNKCLFLRLLLAMGINTKSTTQSRVRLQSYALFSECKSHWTHWDIWVDMDRTELLI